MRGRTVFWTSERSADARQTALSTRQRVIRGAVLLLVAVSLIFAPDAAIAESGKKESGHSAKPSGHSEKSGKSSSKSKGKKKKKKNDDVEEVGDDRVVGADPHLSEKQFAQDAANTARVDAILVLDSSRSMQRTDPNRLRDQGAKLFLRFLSPGDRAAIVQFDREAKIILPMTDISNSNLAKFDQAIDSIPTEGGFTDIEAGLEEAVTILSSEGRTDASKTIVLLSDGKMDPHPGRGTPAELIARVKDQELPQFAQKGFKLYSVAFSDEADKELLAQFAQLGGGLNWFAPDAGTIHKKFSELFLTLKRPQVVPLEGEGFEVDSTVQEATFYINRAEGEEDVSLNDPRGTVMNSRSIPAGVKWFRGERFDVITITRPLPGHWGVTGVEHIEGFATLLTDIKLQVRPLESSYKLGDTIALYARLTNEGNEVKQTGLEEITFFTYKIINSDSGEAVVSGALGDKGEKGDEKAADGIYSGTVKLEKGGEYQALVAVTSPTFTRQQRISFAVSAGDISLRIVPADEFAGTKEHIEVALSRPPTDFKSLKVQLVLKKEGADKALGLVLKPSKEHPEIFDVPLEKLAPGDYELTARLNAIDAKKNNIQGTSSTVHYTVAPREDHSQEVNVEEVVDEPTEEEPGEEPEADEGMSVATIITGCVTMLLACGWLAGLGMFGKKKVGSNKSQIQVRKAWVVPEELTQRIQVIKDRASEGRRRANNDDREIFRDVSDVFGAGDGEGETADQGSESEHA